MQYMMMIFDEWSSLPEAQRSKLMGEYDVFTQGIVKSGHMRAGAQLQPSTTATLVREKAGKRVTSDGPFIETKEQLGGYYIVECKDLDEAIGIAARIPTVKVGATIEVRPVVPSASPR